MVVLGDLTSFTYYGAGFLDGHSPFLNHDEMKELGRFFYELVEKWNSFEKRKIKDIFHILRRPFFQLQYSEVLSYNFSFLF